MAKKKAARSSRTPPSSPREFQEAYLKACSEPGWKPDPKKLFVTYPADRADELSLSAEDRELLVEVGLPFQFSMNGMYGLIKVREAKDKLLTPLEEVCRDDSAETNLAGQVVLAEVGGVEEEFPDYLCLSLDTGYVWHFNCWDGSWTFVNSSLLQFTQCLWQYRVSSKTLKKSPEKMMPELKTIDPDCLDPDAMWPQVMEAETSWWRDGDVPLFGARPEPPPEVDTRPLSKLLPDLIDFGDDYFTCPKLTKKMIGAAEKKLGYKLPESYLQMMRIRNGVGLKKECFPTQERTSWDYDHVQVNGIYGIGGKRGIDGERESQYMIREWGYPDVGIVIGATPSSGHTTVMLDYSQCGPEGEPRVIWVEAAEVEEEDNWVLVLAPDFESLLRGLRDCDEF